MWWCGEDVKIVYLDINPPASTHVHPENRSKTVFNLPIGDLVLFRNSLAAVIVTSAFPPRFAAASKAAMISGFSVTLPEIGAVS
jgi:hypothetical protein